MYNTNSRFINNHFLSDSDYNDVIADDDMDVLRNTNNKNGYQRYQCSFIYPQNSDIKMNKPKKQLAYQFGTKIFLYPQSTHLLMCIINIMPVTKKPKV